MFHKAASVKVFNDGHDAYLLIESGGKTISILETELDEFIRQVMIKGNQLRQEQYFSKSNLSSLNQN
jgi:hypothetical protein